MSDKLSLDWQEQINRIKESMRERIPPSVKAVCDEIDYSISNGNTLTEEMFHQDAEKSTDKKKAKYLQKTLGKMVLFQSHCITDTR